MLYRNCVFIDETLKNLKGIAPCPTPVPATVSQENKVVRASCYGHNFTAVNQKDSRTIHKVSGIFILMRLLPRQEKQKIQHEKSL